MSRRDPDVEVHTTFRADEIRFECKPKADVVAHSNKPAVAEWVSKRHNLPDEVEPGVTYRDVAVIWGVEVRLEDAGE